MKRRQNVLIILFVIAVMAVYTGYEANKPQPIDWSPNFSISKKSPYGTYITVFVSGREGVFCPDVCTGTIACG